MDLTILLANPWVTHLLAIIAGWLGLAQPALIANLWAKILGVASTVGKAQDIIKLIDAMLKAHGLVPPDAPVATANTIMGVANGSVSVARAQTALQVAKKV